MGSDGASKTATAAPISGLRWTNLFHSAFANLAAYQEPGVSAGPQLEVDGRSEQDSGHSRSVRARHSSSGR
jgi:hypothetical protein